MATSQQTSDQEPAAASRGLVFGAGLAGPILLYAVFWMRHPDVLVAHGRELGVGAVAVSVLAMLVIAAIPGLLALTSPSTRPADAFTLGVTVVASILAIDIGSARIRPPTEEAAPAAAAPGPGRARAGTVPVPLAQVGGTSIVHYLGLVLAPVSTVARHHAEVAAADASAGDEEKMRALTDDLQMARDELRRESARLQGQIDQASARASALEAERGQLQTQLAERDAQLAATSADDRLAEAQQLNDELTLRLMEAESTREQLQSALEAARAAAADAEEVRAELAAVKEELATTRSNDAQAITNLQVRVRELEGRVQVLSGPVEVAVGAIIAMGSRVSGVQGNSPGEVKLVRMEAERALREVGTPGLDALVGALADDNALVRDFAADQLGRLGPAAQVALPELNRMAAQDSDPAVRETAQRAITRIVNE